MEGKFSGDGMDGIKMECWKFWHQTRILMWILLPFGFGFCLYSFMSICSILLEFESRIRALRASDIKPIPKHVSRIMLFSSFFHFWREKYILRTFVISCIWKKKIRPTIVTKIYKDDTDFCWVFWPFFKCWKSVPIRIKRMDDEDVMDGNEWHKTVQRISLELETRYSLYNTTLTTFTHK